MGRHARLDLRPFFWDLLPVAATSPEALWEQQFSLVYNCKGGLTYHDIDLMTLDERDWWVRRLEAQIERENEQIRKATKR